jgi:hypothetical protein
LDTQVDIQMPIRKGSFIVGDVIQRFLTQDVGFTFYVEAGDELAFSADDDVHLNLIAKSTQHAHRIKKTTMIAFKRNKLRTRGNSPYVYLADNDILLPEKPIFGSFIDAFERRTELGVVGLCYQKNSDHVACGSMMLRREDFLRIGELRDTATSCVCGYIARKLKELELHVVPVKTYKPTDLRSTYEQGYSDYREVRYELPPDGVLERSFLEDTVRWYGTRFKLFIDN